MTMITSATNFASELESALKENSFGLRHYQVTRETQLESIATVVLLEGDTVTVSLSPQGFEVGLLIGLSVLPSQLMIDKIRSWIRRLRSSTRRWSSCWIPSVRLIVSQPSKLSSHASRSSQQRIQMMGIRPPDFRPG